MRNWSPERKAGGPYVVVLYFSEEAFATLTEWAAEEKVSGAALTAIGAFEHATVGWFDFETKD